MEEKFSLLEEAVDQLKKGGLIIIVDDIKRENEGDFIGAGIKVTPETVNFMINYGRGAFIALFCEDAWCKKIGIVSQIEEKNNTEKNKTQMMTSIDCVKVTSGSSAYDRAMTVRTFSDSNSVPSDLIRPGHVIPIRGAIDGLNERHGHTEAGLEMVKLAGFDPVVAIDLEILNDKGEMASRKELFELSEKFDLPIISIHQILKHKGLE